jgi:hypothetical protein
MVIVLNDNLVNLGFAFWILGVYKLEVLGVLMGSVEFFSPY